MLYGILDLGDAGGYILQPIVGKIVWVFLPIFHYKLLPKFPSAHGAVWNSGPDCTSLPDCARGAYLTTYCFGTLLWTFLPSFPSQAVECYFMKH